MPSHHALVIGASGLIGWAVVDQLLRSYPNGTAPSPFAKITALVNRPLEIDDTFWSDATASGPQFRLVSGVNLLCSDAEFEHVLEAKVPDVATVSHVFYFAFREYPDPEEEVKANVGMMGRAVRAVKSLSSRISFFVYPGGTRGYGIYRPGGIFSAPLTESMADTLPDDCMSTVSYPHYRAMLIRESESQTWTWCELCPDIVVGFTPNGSGYSLAGHWAVYLYAWRLVHGEGSEVPYPGVKEGYESLFTEASATTLARVAIYASLHPEEFRERIFNVADSANPGSMRERWPQICSWFRLKGVAPPATASAADTKPSEFVQENKDQVRAAGVKGVDIWHSIQLDSVGYWLTFDRHLNLERLRKTGFEEEREPQDGWLEAFEIFKKAGMIR